MKRFFLVFSLILFFASAAQSACPPRQGVSPTSSGQQSEDAPEICLESFEMCNNWARHYCRAGNHERAVNSVLRGMKERGVTVTTAIIKSVARRTSKDRVLQTQPTE